MKTVVAVAILALVVAGCAAHSPQKSVTPWGFSEDSNGGTFRMYAWMPNSKMCGILRDNRMKENEKSGQTNKVGPCQPLSVRAGGDWWGVTQNNINNLESFGTATLNKDICEVVRLVGPPGVVYSECSPVSISQSDPR